MKLLYRLIITDKNGKVEKRTHWRNSKSFVQGWLQMLETLNAHVYNTLAPNLVMTDTGGVARTIVNVAADPSKILTMLGAAGDANVSIVVGTGVGAVSNTNTKLGTQIANGNGAGQLTHGASTYVTATVTGVNVDQVWSRTFTNGSGADITVTEIGFYAGEIDTAGTERYFCIIRDLSTVLVPNTKTLTVQYTIRTAA